MTQHNIKSPLLDLEHACRSCHPLPESELRSRIIFAQNNTAEAIQRAEGAILDLIRDIDNAKKSSSAKLAGTGKDPEAEFAKAYGEALEFHRRASLRWDFIASENSTGFHSPQMAATVLQESVDFARRGQLIVQRVNGRAGIQQDPSIAADHKIQAPVPIEGHGPEVGGEPPKSERH